MNQVIKPLTWFIAIMAVIIAVGICPVAAAPSIDGNLEDWGLSNLVSASWSDEATWVPGAGIHYIVEDNKNPSYGPISGVHITGYGSSYSYYNEPMVKLVSGDYAAPPVGGELFDLEAIYLDQDSSNLYLAIVTSTDPALTYGRRPGDIALNMDRDLNTGDLGYEYGIVTGTTPYTTDPAAPPLHQGDIVYHPLWDKQGAVDMPEAPDAIVGYLPDGYVAGNLGSGFVYNNAWMTMTDNGVPNWVIETAIPKASIGNPTFEIGTNDVFYADNCINDTFYVPEFPTIAVSAGAILGLIFIISQIREKKKE